VARRRGNAAVEARDRFEEVLGLQEIALESEAAWDEPEAADDYLVWRHIDWCRNTK
jgi:hypothetical protein